MHTQLPALGLLEPEITQMLKQKSREKKGLRYLLVKRCTEVTQMVVFSSQPPGPRNEYAVPTEEVELPLEHQTCPHQWFSTLAAYLSTLTIIITFESLGWSPGFMKAHSRL